MFGTGSFAHDLPQPVCSHSHSDGAPAGQALTAAPRRYALEKTVVGQSTVHVSSKKLKAENTAHRKLLRLTTFLQESVRPPSHSPPLSPSGGLHSPPSSASPPRWEGGGGL